MGCNVASCLFFYGYFYACCFSECVVCIMLCNLSSASMNNTFSSLLSLLSVHMLMLLRVSVVFSALLFWWKFFLCHLIDILYSSCCKQWDKWIRKSSTCRKDGASARQVGKGFVISLFCELSTHMLCNVTVKNIPQLAFRVNVWRTAFFKWFSQESLLRLKHVLPRFQVIYCQSHWKVNYLQHWEQRTTCTGSHSLRNTWLPTSGSVTEKDTSASLASAGGGSIGSCGPEHPGHPVTLAGRLAVSCLLFLTWFSVSSS